MSLSRSGFTYIVGIKCNHEDHKIDMGQSQLYPWEKWYTLMKIKKHKGFCEGYAYG